MQESRISDPEIAPLPSEAREFGTNERSPRGCNRGAFCACSAPGLVGPLVLETQGNWSGTTQLPGSVFNNGVPWPGADHVQLDFDHGGGPRHTLCIRWRGECGPAKTFWSSR